MHSQNRENVLYSAWLILVSFVTQKRLVNLRFLGIITYFLGKIRNSVVSVPLEVWLHELQ